MAVTVLQTGQVTNINTADPTITFSPALTANSTIAIFFNSIRVATPTIPTGYTAGPKSDTATAFDSVSCYKVATGGETTAQFTSVPSTDDHCIVWIEFAGTPSTSPLDGSSEDETNATSAAQTIATDSGSGVTPTGDGGAVAFFGCDNGLNFEPGVTSVDNSYNYARTIGYAASAFDSAGLAYKIFTGTSAQKCTLTTTDTGDENYGCMLVFKEDGGGGGVTVPIMHNHYRNLRAA